MSQLHIGIDKGGAVGAPAPPAGQLPNSQKV